MSQWILCQAVERGILSDVSDLQRELSVRSGRVHLNRTLPLLRSHRTTAQTHRARVDFVCAASNPPHRREGQARGVAGHSDLGSREDINVCAPLNAILAGGDLYVGSITCKLSVTTKPNSPTEFSSTAPRASLLLLSHDSEAHLHQFRSCG